jgi:hypothetical protein
MINIKYTRDNKIVGIYVVTNNTVTRNKLTKEELPKIPRYTDNLEIDLLKYVDSISNQMNLVNNNTGIELI